MAIAITVAIAIIITVNNIFSIKDGCMNNIQGGRIQKLSRNGKPYILLSTSADSLSYQDQSDDKPQSDNSLYGKIIAIDNINEEINTEKFD